MQLCLEIMAFDHKIFFYFFTIFFYLKKMMLHLLNHPSPISNSPQTHISTNKQLCPQLNSNRLPQGCQPCLLPLSQTLPSEKTTILLYKYQRYIILLATRKHQLDSRLNILKFFKTSYGMEAVTQPLSVISS